MPSGLTDPGRARSPPDRGGHRRSRLLAPSAAASGWLCGCRGSRALGLSCLLWNLGTGCLVLWLSPPSGCQRGGEADTTPQGTPPAGPAPAGPLLHGGAWGTCRHQAQVGFSQKGPPGVKPPHRTRPPTPALHLPEPVLLARPLSSAPAWEGPRFRGSHRPPPSVARTTSLYRGKLRLRGTEARPGSPCAREQPVLQGSTNSVL